VFGVLFEVQQNVQPIDRWWIPNTYVETNHKTDVS